ncbi:MAG TPA: CoA transferase, partial [Tepidiformaceae bacterium]
MRPARSKRCSVIRGYSDLAPSDNSAIFSGDHVVGVESALAVMVAIRQRNRTGEWQLTEVGQAENASAMLARAFMMTVPFMAGPPTVGEIARERPRGSLPCRRGNTAGVCDDHWIAITAGSDP